MKALVCSDCHGRTKLFRKMLDDNPDCRLIFFLGDGENDLHTIMGEYPDREYVYVLGNCDWGDVLPQVKTVAYKHIEGITIVATHGHEFHVKSTLTDLLNHGESVMANAVFYGHTHRPDFHYDPGYKMFVLNPGALGLGSYAKIEINKYGIEAEFKNVFEEAK